MTEALKDTPRLAFRPLTESDLSVVEQILCDSDAMTLALLPPFNSKQAYQRLLQMISGSQFPVLGKLAIVDKQRQQMIGYCGIEQSHIQKHWLHEFGIMMVRNSWGQGLASEAAAQVLRYQAEASELEKVYALVDERNLASKRVLQRAGMRCVRESVYDDQAVDIYLWTQSAKK